jgi:hypothetical protein
MRKSKIINRTEVDIIIKKYNITLGKSYNINEKGKIDVQGDVQIRYSNLSRLPLRFGKVNGFFNCSGLGLKTLKGAAEYVLYNFSCANNKLTSLKYSPNFVGGNFDCSQNQLTNLIGCATEVGRDLVCKMNKLRSLEGSPKEFYGRFNCSYNKLNDFTGVSEEFKGEMYANSNYLKNIKGFNHFDGILFIDPTASSINAGNVDYKDMKIEIRLQSKHGYEFMARPLLDHHKYLNLILKFQRHYEIWTDDDQLRLDYFQMLIEDLQDGLL